MELAQHRTRGTRRLGAALVLASITATLTMAITASAQAAPNTATAWGLNQSGQLGNGTTGPEKCGSEQKRCSTTPVAVTGLSGVTAVAGADETSLALLESRTVMAWGLGTLGQLGNGATENSSVPVAVCAPGETAPCAKELSGVTAIAAGESHNLALLENGTVVAWGSSSDVPVAVSGLSGVTAIAAGGAHSLALLSDGTVEAWGQNGEGQLGDGGTVSSDSPVPVSGLSGVTAVAAGQAYSLALLSNGTVVAWGKNFFGQLGDGGEANSDVPVPVCPPGEKAPCANHLSGVKTISAGREHALALLSNGTVFAWGNNSVGQLGDGSHTGPEGCGPTTAQPCAKSPVKVNGLTGVTAVSGGGRHSLALLSNGAAMAWGENELGQLGVGTSTGPEPCGPTATPCSTTPVAVSTHGGVAVGIAAGGEHSLAFGPKPPPANLPEVGRCVKVAVGTGKYTAGGCLTLATKPGAKKYEWTPASVTEKLAFSGSGLETTLTTAGHSTIKCVAANFSGDWTGPKTASVNVELQGCTNAQGSQCQTVTNPQNKSEIKLNGVLGELGFSRYEELEGKVIEVVGFDLKPQPPMTSFATYECTGSSEAGHIEGSVIGGIGQINKMTMESNLHYVATKSGEQRPEAFQASPTDTLMTSFTSGTEAKGSGASSLNIKEYKGQNAAPLEIKAK
jgi:alpha-tubulin suppressor-like RCC1 family protein